MEVPFPSVTELKLSFEMQRCLARLSRPLQALILLLQERMYKVQ